MGEDDPTHTSPHREGQREVLRIRLSRKCDARDERWINRSVLASVRMQHLAKPAAHNYDMPSSTGISPPESPAATLIDTLVPQATVIRGAISTVDCYTFTAGKVALYARRLQYLQQQLKAWEADLPPEWKYKTASNPLANGQNTSFPSIVIILPSISTASAWIAFWLARISVLRTMAALVPHQLAFHLTAPLLSEIRADMLSVASSICSSVPYMLGQIGADGETHPDGKGLGLGALFATRALFISAQLEDLPEDQLKWILDQLSLIGHTKGIRQALVLKDEVLRNRSAT